MTISATEKAAMNANMGHCSLRVKDLGKKAEEAAAQQRLEKEMVKAEAELKKEKQEKKAEIAAAQQRLKARLAARAVDQDASSRGRGSGKPGGKRYGAAASLVVGPKGLTHSPRMSRF